MASWPYGERPTFIGDKGRTERGKGSCPFSEAAGVSQRCSVVLLDHAEEDTMTGLHCCLRCGMAEGDTPSSTESWGLRGGVCVCVFLFIILLEGVRHGITTPHLRDEN